MITLQNLTVSVEDKKILKDISYEFKPGKVYAIMGPNGSGKSTLANSIMGHPAYTIDQNSKILYQNEDIKELDVDKRAQQGIFLTFQSPLALSGVTMYELIQTALGDKKDIGELSEDIRKYAQELDINPELLDRSLNEGASGGERKKLEMLQAYMFDAKVIMFDEVDTGVDVDSLRKISQFMSTHKKDKTYIIITHYNRILQHIQPDHVLVMNEGQITKEGPASLAKEIEEKGYK